MRAATFLSSALALVLPVLSLAAETAPRTVDIFAWPITSAKPQTLASLSYNSTAGHVTSYHAPVLSTSDEIVRVGFYHASGQWSGVATSAANFADEGLSGQKTVILHVRPDGELYHVGFAVVEPKSQAPGVGKRKVVVVEEKLAVEVRQTKPGPEPRLNKPVVVDAEGQVEGKEKEKTFFEKYWWVMALFLVMQLVIGKGGDGK